MKKEVDKVEAIPSKRLFLSIIADYDLNRSICELIDNVLDLWTTGGKKKPMAVTVDLDKNQQSIRVTDDGGGVKKEDLKLIVGPGQTGNLPEAETIGIFGVGTKRAVVALAQDIKITTRWGDDTTYRVEFDDAWLNNNDDWTLPVYEVDAIDPGTTVIELSRLRVQITDDVIIRLKDHLAATYAKFLGDKRVKINIGTDQLKPITFEAWAYPPNYQPRKYTGTILSEDGGTIKVEALAGLTKVSSPAGGEYGVYFYCNNRLIARALKTYEVGFTKGFAGQPHPSISLARVIISLNGPVQLMPWNSSKSGINPNHNTFIALRKWLVEVVKDYASLSRRLEGSWPQRVFKYDSGDIQEVKISDFPSAKKSYLPPLPKSRLRYSDLCRMFNRKVSSSKPWTTGLYESIIAADVISGQRLEQRNRIALIILDSSLEIAFKEYLVNESKKHYSDVDLLRLFKNRKDVVDEVSGTVSLDDVRKKLDYYYSLRCKLIHERASAGITDSEVNDYRHVAESVMERLFGLNFSW